MNGPPPPGTPPEPEDPLALRLLAVQTVMFRIQRSAAWGLAVAALLIGLGHLLFEVGDYPSDAERAATARFLLLFAAAAATVALLLRHLRELSARQIVRAVALLRRWRGPPRQD